MSLDTYENLKLEIIEWSHRDDLDLLIDTFINQAETDMLANSVERLRIRDQETRASFSTSTTDRFAALPTGYQAMRKMRIQILNGLSHEIYYRTPAQLQIRDYTDMPQFFTVTDQIEFDRISDVVYTGEIQYYQGFTALSDSNTTNTVLTDHPNIYLYGALRHLKLHVKEYGEADYYFGQFIEAIQGANLQDRDGRYGPAPVMRVESSCP
jgi:hypothetical protein